MVSLLTWHVWHGLGSPLPVPPLPKEIDTQFPGNFPVSPPLGSAPAGLFGPG